MNPFQIFNTTAARIDEVQDDSIDLILTSPPYNIGTRYGDDTDDMSRDAYMYMMRNVLIECRRVLRPSGRMILEAADTVVMDGGCFQLADALQSLALGEGFSLERRLFNFAHSRNGVAIPEPPGWNADYVAVGNAHSNCNQILVLSDAPTFYRDTRAFYHEYGPTADHPCPFPRQLVSDLFDMFYEGGAVLDPFMGVGSVGIETLRRGGTFVGVDWNAVYCDIARERLEDVLLRNALLIPPM